MQLLCPKCHSLMNRYERNDVAVVDRVVDAVAARSLLVLEIELDVDKEALAVPPLLLEHAVEPVQDDAVKLDRHPTLPRSTAAAYSSARSPSASSGSIRRMCGMRRILRTRGR